MSLTEQIARYERMTLPVDPQLGQLMMPMGQILALTPGSVIKLPRPLGSKIDVFVGGAPFGSGQLVSAGDHLGLRFSNFSRDESVGDTGKKVLEERHDGA